MSSTGADSKIKTIIVTEDQKPKYILVDLSTKLTNIRKTESASGPYCRKDGVEIIYADLENKETVSSMIDALHLNKEDFEKEVYFKCLSPQELLETRKREASREFEKERTTRLAELVDRIETLKKLKTEVEKLTSLDNDEFTKEFDNAKLIFGLKSSDFSQGVTREKIVDAITTYEEQLLKYKSSSDLKSEVNLNLDEKCLSLLNSCAPNGIVFEDIDPPNFSLYYGETTENFDSKHHWREINQNAFSRGQRLATERTANVSGDTSTQSKRQDNDLEEGKVSNDDEPEAKQALVSRQATQQIATFQAKHAKLKLLAETDARAIAKADKNEERIEKTQNFLEKYPAEISFGPFGVGGRFEIIGITTAHEKIALSQLQEVAYKHVSNDFKAAISLGTMDTAGSVSGGFQRDTIELGDRGTKSVSFSLTLITRTEQYCYGPKVTNGDDMNRILHIDPNTWNIFPSPDTFPQRQFIPIYEVIRRMDENDQELLRAAEILEEFVKKGPQTVKETEDKATQTGK